MEQIVFSINERESVGTNSARALRRSGLLPAILYSSISKAYQPVKTKNAGKNDEKKDINSDKSMSNGDYQCTDTDISRLKRCCSSVVTLPISLNYREFDKLYRKGGIKSKVLILNLPVGTEFTEKAKSNVKTVIREIQCDPITGNVIHVDLQEMDESLDKVHVSINVHLLNADKCIGIKQKGGNLNLIKRTIDVMCSTKNVISFIEIDIANLNVGHSIHIGDIIFPDGVEPIDKANATVLSVSGHYDDTASKQEIVDGESNSDTSS